MIIKSERSDPLKCIYTLFVLLPLITFCSCDSKEENKSSESNPVDDGQELANTITINGDGYTNTIYYFDAAAAHYFASNNSTHVALGHIGVIDIALHIYFVGQEKTHQFEVDEHGTILQGVTLDIVAGEFKMYVCDNNSGTITVTKYGKTGELISGTFTGTLHNADSLSQITVSGAFNATRYDHP